MPQVKSHGYKDPSDQILELENLLYKIPLPFACSLNPGVTAP
jgi:hypothetical protein